MLGMTETGSVCLMSRDETDQPEHRRGSFGRPVPGLDAAGRRPRDARRRRRSASVGELWFRGPVADGGLLRARALRGVHRPTAGTAPATCSRVDADGFFYFHGRRGDMIKTAGANVSPREVEAALRDVTGGLGGDRARPPRRRARPGRRRGDPGRARRPRPTSTRCAPTCARACRRTRCRAGSSCSRRTSCRCSRAASPTCAAIAELLR